VYREGDALRVEYQSGESARVVLPFWADDRETAEKIVRLLPTSQTVEIEHSTDVTHSGKPRADWSMLLSFGIMLVALMAGSWALYERMQLPLAPVKVPLSNPVAAEMPFGSMPMPDATASLVESPASPAVETVPAGTVASPAAADAASTGSAGLTPDFLEPPSVELRAPGPLPLPRDYVRSADFVIPIARGTAAYEVAKRELNVFGQETFGLEAGYRALRNLLEGGTITPEDFAAKLRDQEMRWWNLTFRIFDNDALADPALLDLRATMLGAARLWRSFLTTYSEGILERDHVMIAGAFDELARAQEMQSRARLFVR
jgi:hypothetical protein